VKVAVKIKRVARN